MDPNALAQQLAGLDSQFNDPTKLYNEATTRLGIPDARTRVQNLRTTLNNTNNLLEAVDPSVTGRTQNSLVTESQRQRLVNMEREPIAGQLKTYGTQYDTANADLTNLTKQADDEVARNLSGYQTKRQSLLDQIKIAQDQQARQDAINQAAQAAQSARARTSSGGGGSGSGAPSVTPAQKMQSDYAAIGGALARVRGGDGFVSPDSYAKAKADFVSLGYSPQEFDKQWANLRNPTNKYYKLG